jgi:hypothetical protein
MARRAVSIVLPMPGGYLLVIRRKESTKAAQAPKRARLDRSERNS